MKLNINKHRVCTTEEALLALATMTPYQAHNHFKGDTKTPVSMKSALDALCSSHGIEAVAIFISHLTKNMAHNRGAYGIQKSLGLDYINKNLSKF